MNRINQILICVLFSLSTPNIYSQTAVVTSAGWSNTSKGLIHVSIGEIATLYGVIKEQGVVDDTGENHQFFNDVKYYWNEGFLQQQNKKTNTALPEKEPLHSLLVHVYPNPFTERLTLNVPKALPSDLMVKMYNAQGAEVYKSMIMANSVISTHTFSSGLYTLAVYQNGQRVFITKLIKLIQE